MAGPVPASVRSQARLAAALAAVAGYVDAYGLLRFKTYLSFMSGNTTQTGSGLGRADWASAAPSGVAILAFVAGVVAGTLTAHAPLRRPDRVRFGVVAALLAVVLAFSLVGSLPTLVGIALASLAMGIMNTTISRVGGQSVNVGFVTGTLNQAGSHLAQGIRRAPLPGADGPWDTHLLRAALMFGVWAAFFAGALVSGAATVRFEALALLPPLLALLWLAAFHPPDPEAIVVGRGQ